MRLTIVNLLMSGAKGEGTECSAGILARMRRKMNRRYAGRRTAADAAHKVGGVKVARRVIRRPGERRAHNHKCGLLRKWSATVQNNNRRGVWGPAFRGDDDKSRLSQGRQNTITPPFCGAAPARRRSSFP